MIDPITCLATAIFFESRSESLQGQIAVAQVIMNRVQSPRYPNDICSVVKQRDQLSFYWDGLKEDIPTHNKIEVEAWQQSNQIASAFLAEGGNGNNFVDMTNGALHYAVVGVQRKWMVGAEYVQIGNHNFYIGVK